jgi:hypothetical protein
VVATLFGVVAGCLSFVEGGVGLAIALLARVHTPKVRYVKGTGLHVRVNPPPPPGNCV